MFFSVCIYGIIKSIFISATTFEAVLADGRGPRDFF
jgi:hypothetical protein